MFLPPVNGSDVWVEYIKKKYCDQAMEKINL